jgi:hypothetical protein
VSDSESVVVEWTDATGTTWRVCRSYSVKRQQWEAAIESKARDTWFRRETMVLDGPEVFDQ